MSLFKLFTGVSPIRDTIQQLSTLIPSACEHCDKPGTFLCQDCYQQLEWIDSSICANCGTPILDEQADTQCANCRGQSFATDSVCTPLWYHGAVPSLIHALKYNGRFGVAKPLANFLHMAWTACNQSVDMIVPLPLHPQREKQRGYNQSALIGRELASTLNIPIVKDGLFRKRATRTQMQLSAVQRAANMHNAFWANQSIVQGRTILLIDDVYTTGATIEAAAIALKKAGATAVHASCVARAYVPTVHHYQLNHPVVEGTVI